MKTDFLIYQLLSCLVVVTLARAYLHRITKEVITEICQTPLAATFWLRLADVLAYSGSMCLVLVFGSFANHDWASAIRLSTTLTLIGVMFAVFFVAKKVLFELRWRDEEHKINQANIQKPAIQFPPVQ